MRMVSWRNVLGILLLAIAAPSGLAQSITLAEAAKKGDCSHIRLHMELSGDMQATKDGKQAPLKLTASAAHDFVQKVLETSDKGLPNKAACVFEQAKATITVGSEKTDKALRSQRKLIVSQRFKDQPLSYCPLGPLTHEELELVGERFDTLALAGLLPGKSVATGDTWKLANSVVQALCSFEGLTEQSLAGKLVKKKDNIAEVTITGTASGIDLGAQVKVKVDAILGFDVKTNRIVTLDWTQEDDREQGPASPATKIKAVTKMERAAVATPESLSDAALVSVPDNFEPPAKMTYLEYHDLKSRYDLAYAREWQIVGQTSEHLILRFMERGDFIAQVTLTPWTSAAKGKHLSAEEFKDAMARTPGWEPENELQAGEVPTDDNRWIYRLSAQGKMDDETVVQNFFLVAGPDGDQVVLAFIMTPKQADRLGTRDLSLAGSLGFPKK
ncbi:MAG: hypothetical protein ACJ8FY_20230 [Gemmataceae bacterium]